MQPRGKTDSCCSRQTDSPPTVTMPENQHHGFAWENDIKTKVFLLDPSIDYTATHDIPKEQNRFDHNENVSLKTTGRTTVDLGDAQRVFSYLATEIHTMFVVKYAQQDDTHKVLNGIYEMDLSQRDILWGSITATDIQELNALIRSVPVGQRTPPAVIAKKKEMNARSGVIKFNPKIDSKNQRRLQCSIPKFAECLPILKSSTTDPVLRGIPISSSIVSGRRVRNSRNSRIQETSSLSL